MSAVAPIVSVRPAVPAISIAQALIVAISVAGTGATPTGTVTLASGGYSSGAITLAAGAASITVPAGILALGSDTLTASYAPDSGSSAAYTAATGTGTVTVAVVAVSLPAKLQGYKAQISYTPAGGGTPVLVAGVKDLEGGFKADELDATDHGNNGWKSRLLGLLDFEGSVKLDYIAGDASQEYLLQSILQSRILTIALLPVDSAGSGVDSYVGTVIITDFKWSGKNNDLQSADITLKGAGPFAVVTQ